MRSPRKTSEWFSPLLNFLPQMKFLNYSLSVDYKSNSISSMILSKIVKNVRFSMSKPLENQRSY